MPRNGPLTFTQTVGYLQWANPDQVKAHAREVGTHDETVQFNFPDGTTLQADGAELIVRAKKVVPTQPTEPTQPTQPTQSTQPMQPTQPTQPNNGTQPSGNVPTTDDQNDDVVNEHGQSSVVTDNGSRKMTEILAIGNHQTATIVTTKTRQQAINSTTTKTAQPVAQTHQEGPAANQRAERLPQAGNRSDMALGLSGLLLTAALSLFGIEKRRN